MVNGKSLLCSAGGGEDQASRASDIHCDIHSFPEVRIRKETEIGQDQASPVSKVLLARASFPASEDELSIFLGPGPIFGLPCYLLPRHGISKILQDRLFRLKILHSTSACIVSIFIILLAMNNVNSLIKRN